MRADRVGNLPPASVLVTTQKLGHVTPSGTPLTQNLKPPWTVLYSTTNFGGACYKIYACFERKRLS